MTVTTEAVKAAAMVRMRQYESEYSLGNLTWKDFADEAREVLEAAFAAQAPAADRWWITTGPLAAGGEKVLGPFASQDLALRVRTMLEHFEAADGRYWVDDEDTP